MTFQEPPWGWPEMVILGLDDNNVSDFDDNVIGTYEVTKTWQSRGVGWESGEPFTYTMRAIRATIDGKQYVGRTSTDKRTVNIRPA